MLSSINDLLWLNALVQKGRLKSPSALSQGDMCGTMSLLSSSKVSGIASGTTDLTFLLLMFDFIAISISCLIKAQFLRFMLDLCYLFDFWKANWFSFVQGIVLVFSVRRHLWGQFMGSSVRRLNICHPNSHALTQKEDFEHPGFQCFQYDFCHCF